MEEGDQGSIGGSSLRGRGNEIVLSRRKGMCEQMRREEGGGVIAPELSCRKVLGGQEGGSREAPVGEVTASITQSLVYREECDLDVHSS